MNNAILFFYNINIQEIKRINNNYYFTYQQNNYVIYKYNRDISEINEIYELNIELLSKGLIGYEIIPNKTNELIFLYENNYYVLMKIPNIKNKKITYEDILSFNFIQNQNKYKTIDKSNWNQNWSKKIDYIIYQFSQIKNKHKEIDSSIDYFIGIWENAISYYNNIDINNNMMHYISHKRLKPTDKVDSLYNPLNIIYDYRVRDVAEYIKNSFWTDNHNIYNELNNYIYKSNLSLNEVKLLISRVLFPSFYFDLYEDIFNYNKDEKILNNIISRIDEYEEYLNSIIIYFKRFYPIDEIEWLKKKIIN